MTQVAQLTIQMQADVARLRRDMAAVQKTVETTMGGVEKRVGSAMNVVRGFGGAFASIQSVRAVSNIADQYTKFTAQLKLATDNQGQFNQAYGNTLDIARRAQSDVNALGTLYARITNSTRELGLSQSEVASITETVALSLRVSGATANESASAMLQLSQAFGSGVLRGEEFNAVNEAAPGLMRALADSINVPVGALREMASEGQLTSEVLAAAFKDELLIAKLREQAKEVQTIGSAVTSLKNEFTIYIGELDRSTGASRAVSQAILGLSENLDVVTRAAGGFLAVYTTKKVLDLATSAGQLTAATIAQARASSLARDTAIAEAAAKVSNLQATQAGIIAARAEYVERLNSANASIALAQAQIRASQANGAYSASLLAVRQAEVAATAASRARSVALAELAILGQQAARTNTQLAASQSALSLAQGVGIQRLSTLARSVRFMGGWVGVVTTALSLGATAWALWGGTAESSEKKASNAVADSTEKIVSDLDKQIEKINVRNELMARGIPLVGSDEQLVQMEKIARQIDEVMQKGTIDGKQLATVEARQSVLVVLGNRYAEIQKSITASQEKQAQIAKDGQAAKLAEYMTEYASSAEKAAAAIAKAKKELGDLYTPEIEMRIKQRFEPAKGPRAKGDDTDYKMRELEEIDRVFDELWKKEEKRQEDVSNARKRLFEEGTKVFEETRTPLEKYVAELERLQMLFNEGVIDPDTFGRAVGKATTELENFGKTGRSEIEDLEFAIQGFGRKSADAFVDFALTGKASFTDLTDSILSDLARLLVQQNVTDPLFKAISAGAKSEGGLGGGLGSIFSGVGDYISDNGGLIGAARTFFGFANGGIMTPYGPMKLNAYAGGGIVNSPQMYVAGEGRMNEAIIPLPDGRSVPVTMTGGGMGDVNVEVNVINQGQPANARVVGQRQTGNGLSIDVLIDTVDNALGARMSKGQGSLANAVPRKFGLNGAAGNAR